MDDSATTFAADTQAATPSRAAGQGFATDSDRGFLYKVLSVHAKAGSAPAEAAERLGTILASPRSKPTGAAALRLSGRLHGARLLARAFAEAAKGSPEKPVSEHLAKAGLSMTPEEEAAFAVPSSTLDRLPLAAELLDAVAGFMRETTRP